MRTRAYPPILHALAADAYSPTLHAEWRVGAREPGAGHIKVTLSRAAMWSAGAVRCSSVGVTVADGGHRNSDEVFLVLQLRRRVGGDLLWQPFAAAIVPTLRGTRRHPTDTECAARGYWRDALAWYATFAWRKLAAGACRKR